MSEASARLVVGLGNPGEAYRDTRHNAGFKVVEELSRRFAISLDKNKFQAHFGRGSIEGVEVILVKPLAFMNNSGPPVRRLADFFKISNSGLLVIHDDVDLSFGRLKIKEKGGHGGHNGLKSLMSVFGGGDFARLRVGIGRPAETVDVTGHVLGQYSMDESDMLNRIIARARDAVVAVLTKGLKDGMNRFNDKQFLVSR
jgi:peptidyl-tRNA hydrolase, PTH1 family